jgi:hypothetical protein
MTAILALDLGKRTGWACGPPELGPARHGSLQLAKPGATHGRIAANFASELQQLIDTLGPDLIVFESPLPPAAQSAAHSARILYGLAWQTEAIAFLSRIKCFEATVQEVRQFFLGHGRLKSEDAEYAIARKCKLLGWTPQDHNVADAFALWSYQAAIVSPRFELKRHAGIGL